MQLSRIILLFYTSSQAEDQRRLAVWINQLILNPETPYLSYVQRDDEVGNSWKNILPLMAKRMLQTVADFPRSDHCLTFVSAAKEIVNDLKRRSEIQTLSSMTRTWYWKILRKYVMAFVCGIRNIQYVHVSKPIIAV